MGFQDEFARRLGDARGVATGEGGDRALPCHSREGGNPDRDAHGANALRHAELDSASRAASDDRSDKTLWVLNQVQDDDGRNTVSPELVEGRQSDEKRGSTGHGIEPARGAGSRSWPLTDTTNTPSPTPTTRHDGWLPELRVKFLEALARTGNVGAAAHYVQRSRQSAYDLKRRDANFARAWLAALVLAREVAQDKLQERAIEGVEEEIFYHGEVVATRRRYDSRLLLAHLARLDKIAEQIPAQRGAARFGEMLDAIGAGEDTAPLVATPTGDELAAEAEERRQREGMAAKPEEEEAEFYEVHWPDNDGPPEYYRMTPEEAAEMERDVPGLTARATGTADDAIICAMVHEAQALAEFRVPGAEKGKNP